MTTLVPPISPARAMWLLLTFRLREEEFLAFGRLHLLMGLFWTWLAGIGRWWDDPGARLLQHLGLGSVAYAFALAGLLWLLVLPLGPVNWSYQRVLTFVTFTSPPALLYAIPVERFADQTTAAQLNVWFLAIVASWRVALLLRFLMIVPHLGVFKGVVTTLLPLSAIVASLTALNLHRVVFRIMGGLGEHKTSAHDAAYKVLVLLTLLALTTLPLLLLLYIGAVMHTRRKRRAAASPQSVPTRSSARLFVLDDQDRLLLLCYHPAHRPPFWSTPGGRLEPGESFEAAARRELAEETGLDVPLGPRLKTSEEVLAIDGAGPTLCIEHYFLVDLRGGELDFSRWSDEERRVIRAHRWWSAEELMTTSEVVLPAWLPQLLQSTVAQRKSAGGEERDT